MKIEKRLAKQRQRRRFRVRNRVRRHAYGRPRLSVFRSNKHIYAQIIDDEAGRTLASAGTLEKDVIGSGNYGGNKAAAEQVGRLIAERALAAGVKQVVFDRGPNKYHGRIAALGAAARDGGLEF